VVSQIVEEAQREGTPLSELERKVKDVIIRLSRVCVSSEIGGHGRLRSQNTWFRNSTKHSDCMCRMNGLRFSVPWGFWNVL